MFPFCRARKEQLDAELKELRAKLEENKEDYKLKQARCQAEAESVCREIFSEPHGMHHFPRTGLAPGFPPIRLADDRSRAFQFRVQRGEERT